MLKEAITFPTKGDEAAKTILLGGVFSLLGIFIAPAIVYGYIVEIYRAGMNGDAEPPTFSDWEDLAIKGLKAFVIILAYFTVLIVLFFLSIFSTSIGSTATGGVATSTGASLGMMAPMAVSGVLFLVVCYLLPAAMANFAKEDSLEAAFAFGTIKDAVLTGDYLVGWLLVVAVMIPTMVINFFLNIIPMLGMIVGFYFQIVVAYIMGRSYAKALDLDVESGGSGSTGAEV